MTPPTISTSLARHVLDDAVTIGMTKTYAQSELRVTDEVLEHSDARIPADRIHTLIEHMLAVGGPDAFLTGWSQKRFADLGPLGFLAATSDDVRSSLARVCPYMPTFTTDLTYRTIVDDEGVHLFIGSPCAARQGLHARMAGAVGMLVALAPSFTGSPLEPVRVRLPGPACPQTSLRRDLFGDDVSYGGPVAELVTKRDLLDQPLKRADHDLSAFFEDQLSEQLLRLKVAGGLVEEVRSAVRALLPTSPTLPDAARLLGMSTRTLQRRLTTEGTTFAQVVDDLRHALALQRLTEGASIGEVTFSLGFSEPSAFHRAFKRWTGTTPRLWRAGGSDR
ncbi:MAG: AraC family transcriptional regulator [Myxococcales bacterium]|nr:AraC family transcriptional regulator [Myxococcales bacterium]